MTTLDAKPIAPVLSPFSRGRASAGSCPVAIPAIRLFLLVGDAWRGGDAGAYCPPRADRRISRRALCAPAERTSAEPPGGCPRCIGNADRALAAGTWSHAGPRSTFECDEAGHPLSPGGCPGRLPARAAPGGYVPAPPPPEPRPARRPHLSAA